MFTEPIGPVDPARAAAEAEMRRKWLEDRRTGLGASDVAAIFGVSPYKSALALYFEKRGEVEMPESEREALYWGRILEGPIGQRYSDETGRPIVRCDPFTVRRHPTHSFLIATPDALAQPSPIGPVPPAGGPGVVQIKNAGFFKREDWRDEPPLAFQIQVNHEMLVTGVEWGSIAALVGGVEFFWTDLSRNNGFIEVLVQACRDFWQRVKDGNPPDPDHTESTKKLLKQLYPRDTGEIIALAPEFIDVDDELQRLKAEQKKLQERRDFLEARLKLAIGDATAATLDNGAVYTLKTTDRREFTTPATSFRTLRRKGE